MKRVLSIEIGTEFVKVCDVEYQKKNPRIYRSTSFRTPNNTVEDGYIRDKERLAENLRQKLRKVNITGSDVVYTIASSKIATREIMIPAVKENRIREIISTGAQEYFPVDISEYTVTYSILERKKEDGLEQLRLLLIAAPDNLIRNYYNFSELMDFHVVSIDYTGNSIYQLVKREFPQGVVMAVQVNEKATLVNIINNGTLLLQRSVPYGIKNQFKEEAAATISADGAITGQDERVRSYITEKLEELITSVERITDYHYSKNPELPIQQIQLTGDITSLKNVEIVFFQRFSIPTKRLESLTHRLFTRNEENLKSGNFISCIGASMAPVNFLSKDIAAREAKRSGRNTMQVVFFVSMGLSLVLVILSGVQYLTAKGTAQLLEQQIRILEPVEQTYSEYAEVKKDYEQLTVYDEWAKNPNDKLNELITKIEQALPTSAYISAFEIDSEVLSFTVETTLKLSAAKMIMNFKEIPEITNISVPSIISETDENGTETLNYTLTCSYAQQMQEENGEAGE